MTRELPTFPKAETFRSNFDTVEYLKDWFGILSWPRAYDEAKTLVCPGCFRSFAETFDVPLFAQRAWYDLIFGGGEWLARSDEAFKKHERQAKTEGYETGYEAMRRTHAGEICVVVFDEVPHWLQPSYLTGLEADKEVYCVEQELDPSKYPSFDSEEIRRSHMH